MLTIKDGMIALDSMVQRTQTILLEIPFLLMAFCLETGSPLTFPHFIQRSPAPV